MKKIFFPILLLLFISSCKNENEKTIEELISEKNVSAIRAKRAELTTQYDALMAKITQLDNAIRELDTLKKLERVTIRSVKDTLFAHYVEIQGNVATKQNIEIKAEFPGALVSVFVKTGQKVAKGQLLAKIDDGGLAQQVAQVKAQAELAKTTYERQKRLWEQKIGSEIQYLQAKTSYEAQQNMVQQLSTQLAKTAVTAPFPGVIDDIFSEQGTVVNPGARLMRIVNLNNMYIEAEVPEKYLTSVKKGSNVWVEFPMLGEKLETTVAQASDFINPNNRSFKVEINVPNASGTIKPNLTARLKIKDYTNPQAIIIPQSIISENAEGDQYVYLAKPKDSSETYIAQKAIIQTGQTQEGWVEVTQGLQKGDRLIEEGARNVKEGQEIAITNQPQKP